MSEEREAAASPPEPEVSQDADVQDADVQDADVQDAETPDAEARGADAQHTVGGQDEDHERVRQAIDELRRLRVEDLAVDMAVSLVTVGYQKLGLTEQTRELRDLDGARLSIELLRACLDVLERERGAAGLGDLRATLSAMQLNYARAVDEQRAAEATEAPAAETERAAAPSDGE